MGGDYPRNLTVTAEPDQSLLLTSLHLDFTNRYCASLDQWPSLLSTTRANRIFMPLISKLFFPFVFFLGIKKS